MGASASERNRELLARSAALLAADYPLDVLIERLCNAIAATLQATVYVALPDAGDAVRIAYLTQCGTRRETDGSPMPPGSRVARVFATGSTIAMRERGDWTGEPECVFVFPDGTTDSMAEATSAIYAPIAYGKDVLGVMTVQHHNAHAFNADDVELIESVARYLAIALRNQRALQIAASPVRYPWYVAVIIVLVAVFASTAELYTMCARVTEIRDQSTAIRTLMLGRVAGSIWEHLRDNVVYANVTEQLVGSIRGDRAQTERLLTGLVRASDHGYFFGAGVFYAPGVFDTRSSLFGPYVYSYEGRLGMRENTESLYNYVDASWYKVAVAAHGSVFLTDPYFLHGRTYVSAVKAFYDKHGLAGVISIDSLVGGVESVVRSRVSPGNRAVVVNAFGKELLSSSPPLRGDVVMVSRPLPGTAWTLRLYSDNTSVSDQKRRLAMMALGIFAVIWSIAGALLAFLASTYRERRNAANLRMQRTELQTEIATRIDAEERLRNAAYHDALTGLPNRAFFFDQLHDVLSRHEGERDLQYAVLFVDLDRFYVVNDTLGHSAGDALLRSIALRMQEALPAHVLIARLGGDEFVLLLPSNAGVLTDACTTAELILDEFRRPFYIGDREAYTGASIGVVIVDDTYADAEAVLRDADISMYQAKRSGRARYAVFDRTLRSKISEQLEMEADLRGAVERGEIVPYYQPIVRARDGSVTGFEALARWNRPAHGVVGAGEFIGIAEQAGLLRPIDAAMFERVCAEAAPVLSSVPGGRISVNVSAADLTRVNLIDDMELALEQNGLSPSALRIEITETAVMEDADLSLEVLGELRARGFSIVVDDFGVGHSSLSYLQRLPISGVKVDRSFIAPLGVNAQALEILRAIVVLANTLDLFVVAEGVETAEQFWLVQSVGVDYAQGFFFSQPVPSSELLAEIGIPSSR